MIQLIERLISAGHAYAVDRHVLFSVPSMLQYGQLSRRSLDEMLAGARVDVAPYKRGDMDFVLWKPSQPSEPGWDSPWGRGRPGWHIECSAMSWTHLGEIFDIHGGGIDLIFPHHENEIAQSCCAFDREIMAHYWMHNGFLQVEGEKMSKSLGNFVTIHELLASETFGGRAWSGPTLRLAMLRTHYRQPIDWTVKALEDAAKVYNDWIRAIDRVTPSEPTEEFIVALNDDLNFAKAEAHLHILKKSNPAALAACLKLMGFASHKAASDDQSEEAQLAKIGLTKSDLEQLISHRIEARLTKNWTESDRIRDQLESLGITLKDNKDGTMSWTMIS